MLIRPPSETWLAAPPRTRAPSHLIPWLTDPSSLTARIREEAASLGFTRFGISGVELGDDESHLRRWLDGRLRV